MTLALLMMLAVWLVPAASAARICPEANITVAGASRTEANQICRAFREAARFFADVGMKPPQGVTIRLVDHLTDGAADADELGRYDGRQNLILVLTFEAARNMARREIPGLGVAMNRALWRSYLVHELAHAAVHAGCDRACPDRAGHEYIAAIAQLAALPESIRADILRHHREVEAFGKHAEISEIYYALSPCRFAVKSWLHYRQPGNGPGFIRSLLNPARDPRPAG